MIGRILLAILLAMSSSILSWLGVGAIVAAVEASGGETLLLFAVGVAVTLVSWVGFALFGKSCVEILKIR